MRRLFTVLAKLLGLCLGCWAASSACTGIFAAISFLRYPLGLGGGPIPGLSLPEAAYNLLGFPLYAFIGWGLLFRANAIADLLEVTDAASDAPSPEVNLWLRFGIILIGVFVFATAAPAAASALGFAAVLYQNTSGKFVLFYDAAANAVMVVLATMLALNPAKFARFIRLPRQHAAPLTKPPPNTGR